MSWFKVDDRLHGDDKVSRLFAEHPRHASAALGLWVLAGSWCAQHRTDGCIPASVVRELNRRSKSTDALIAALEAVGLWRRSSSDRMTAGVQPDAGRMPAGRRLDDGRMPAGVQPDADRMTAGVHWEFVQWSKYNPTRAELERKDEENRLRQQRHRGARNALREEGVTPIPARPDPTRPIERESARAHEAPPRFVDVHPAPSPAPARDPVARLGAGYAERYERATGDPWMALGANHRHVAAVAAWLEAKPGDFDAEAARWLDAVFANQKLRGNRWPWKWLAEDPGRFLERGGEAVKSAEELIAKYGRGRASA